MAKRFRRARGGPRVDDGDEETPFGPRVIFTKDWLDPRWFARPGHAEDASSGVPSRWAMRFIYAVFILVVVLCVLTFILKSLGK